MALVKDNEREELAAAYSCFLLHDAGVEVSAENITKLMTGAGIKANPFYAALFGKVLAGKNIEDFISVSAAPAAAAAAAPAGEAKGEEKKEEKKEEKEEEEDADLGLDLFG